MLYILKTLHYEFLRGPKWFHCLLLISLRKMLLSSCKIVLFCMVWIIFFRKVFNYFSHPLDTRKKTKTKQNKNKTKSKKKNKTNKQTNKQKTNIPSEHVSIIHTCILFNIGQFCFPKFAKVRNSLCIVSLWYDSWC